MGLPGRLLALGGATGEGAGGLARWGGRLGAGAGAGARGAGLASASAQEGPGEGGPPGDLPYPTYVDLSAVGQAAVAAGAALGALRRPGRADLVAALGETTGGPALRCMLARMRDSEEGQRVLAARPRVTAEAMAHAWELPPHTFGGAYAEFMGRRSFSPDGRPPPRFRACPEEAFVAQRAREVHDFWHVLFGCPTTVLGELSLKALEFVQTGLPVGALSLAAAARLETRQRRQLFTEQLPWAFRAGRTCPDLICLFYEEHLVEDLESLRARWGIIRAPQARGSGREIGLSPSKPP